MCVAMVATLSKGGTMQLKEILTLAATLIGSGWVAAVIVQLLKREQWPSSVKLILSMVVAALVGVAAAWLSGDVTRFVTLYKAGTLTADQVIAFAVLVFTAAQVWYHANFKQVGWAQSLGKIGSKE